MCGCDSIRAPSSGVGVVGEGRCPKPEEIK